MLWCVCCKTRCGEWVGWGLVQSTQDPFVLKGEKVENRCVNKFMRGYLSLAVVGTGRTVRLFIGKSIIIVSPMH